MHFAPPQMRAKSSFFLGILRLRSPGSARMAGAEWWRRNCLGTFFHSPRVISPAFSIKRWSSLLAYVLFCLRERAKRKGPRTHFRALGKALNYSGRVSLEESVGGEEGFRGQSEDAHALRHAQMDANQSLTRPPLSPRLPLFTPFPRLWRKRSLGKHGHGGDGRGGRGGVGFPPLLSVSLPFPSHQPGWGGKGGEGGFLCPGDSRLCDRCGGSSGRSRNGTRRCWLSCEGWGWCCVWM